MRIDEKKLGISAKDLADILEDPIKWKKIKQYTVVTRINNEIVENTYSYDQLDADDSAGIDEFFKSIEKFHSKIEKFHSKNASTH